MPQVSFLLIAGGYSQSYVSFFFVFSQITSMVTLPIMTGSTMRPAATASCLKTPLSSLTASQRGDTSSCSVSRFSNLHLVF